MLGDAMLTLFWIVGITNAFNLLDNMDGLCSAGIADHRRRVLLMAWSAAHSVTPDGPVSRDSARRDRRLPRSSTFIRRPIFMGDTGSLFLGLNLAAMALVDKPRTGAATGLLPIVAVPGPAAAAADLRHDARDRDAHALGTEPVEGGRDHTSHRLGRGRDCRSRARSSTLWLFAACGRRHRRCLLQRLDPGLGADRPPLIVPLAMAIFAVYLARIRVYDDADLRRAEG